jgi:hypothetical protein
MTKTTVVATGKVAKCGAVHKAVTKVAKVAHTHKAIVTGWNVPYWYVTATPSGLVSGWIDPTGGAA